MSNVKDKIILMIKGWESLKSEKWYNSESVDVESILLDNYTNLLTHEIKTESRQMLIRYSMWLQEHGEQPYSTDHVDQFIRDDNSF